MEQRGSFFDSSPEAPSTLYIGGGTPSLMSTSQLRTVSSAAISTFFSGKGPEEFTMEVNPDDITPEYAAALRSIGITRISMGVQSFDDTHLKWMHRRHTAAGAIHSFEVLRQAGFNNISLDLIFGYSPSEDYSLSMKSWEEDLQRIISLRPEHISAYQMSIEPGSALASLPGYTEPPQEYCAKQYSLLQSFLSDAGYAQYEISNFSLPGFESRHNSSYWKRNCYIGLGPAAHSFSGRTRSWNPSDIDAYTAMISNPNKPHPELSETLTDEEILEETIMLGLRQTAGLSINISDSSLPSSFRTKLSDLISRSLLIHENGSIRIPSDKLFISDYIISELL